MSVLLIFMYQYISLVFERDLSNRGRFLAHTIGEQSASPILTQKFLTLKLMLLEAKKADKDLAYLFITDPKGDVTAHTFGQAFPVDLKKIGISDKKGKSRHRIRIDNQEVLDFSHPIFSGTLGTLHVGMSEARIDTKLQWIFLLSSGVIIVLFITAAWLLWLSLEKIIIRPIKKLEQAIGKVQEVGFEGTITVVDNDEIGQLGSAFNQMAEHLKAVDLQQFKHHCKIE